LNRRVAVVDASILYAAADVSDASHWPCRNLLNELEVRFYVPALVVAEATYLVGARLGAEVEAAFLAELEHFAVEAPNASDWSRIAELVRTYRDFPLGGTDASVAVLAEKLDTDLILTLDRRHFAAIRPRHVAAFTLLPE
jgi:uncharacterized protein